MTDVNAILTALKTAWTSQPSLVAAFTGGFARAEPPALTQRPYVVVTMSAEAPIAFSNKSRFGRVLIDFAIVADLNEDDGDSKGAGGSLAAALDNAVKTSAPGLELADGFKIGKVRPGQVREEESNNRWTVTKTWEFTVSGPK